jgi:hypothetical protein
MANEDGRSVLHRECPLGHCHVVRQRRRRVLHDRHAVATLLQLVVDALPAGAVHEPPMYQNHVLHAHDDLLVGVKIGPAVLKHQL